MKLRKSKLPVDAIIDLYVNRNMTMQHIADKAGITRQAVKLILDRNGVEYRGGKQDRICMFCNETFQATRNRIKKGGGDYCSVQCFHASRSLSGEYSPNGGYMARMQQAVGASDRTMGRRARKQIEGLQPGQVVHHIDGNRTNNDPSNLMVFNSHAEHMAHHHALRMELRDRRNGWNERRIG